MIVLILSLFSATWPEDVRRIAARYMRNPIQIYVGTLDLTVRMPISIYVFFKLIILGCT